jgi:ABC-type multidrug transport system fused ATPase/permease subunit
VLGLLIASANSTFQTQSTQVQQLTANIVLLDRTLAQYGPETDLARNLLRRGVASMADRIWRENGADSGKVAPFEASAAALSLYDEILKLSPRNEMQRSLQARALDTVQDLGKTRLLLFAEAGMAIPIPFLVVLISWLTIIFASFSLFADNNATTIVALGIFAVSASAAIFLILELSQPFTGLMTISSEPLRNALAPSAALNRLRFMSLVGQSRYFGIRQACPLMPRSPTWHIRRSPFRWATSGSRRIDKSNDADECFSFSMPSVSALDEYGSLRTARD